MSEVNLLRMWPCVCCSKNFMWLASNDLTVASCSRLLIVMNILVEIIFPQNDESNAAAIIMAKILTCPSVSDSFPSVNLLVRVNAR